MRDDDDQYRVISARWGRVVRAGWWYVPLIHWGLPLLVAQPRGARVVRLPLPARVIAMVFSVSGGALTLWSLWTLVMFGHGTPSPFDPPRRFVCRGPYRWCRNPMEQGNVLTMIGGAVARGSVRHAVASAIFWRITDGWIVAIEEPTLRRQFGALYVDYTQTVPRWGCRATPLRFPPI